MNNILKPKSPEDVIKEIERRIKNIDYEVIKETPYFKIFYIKNSNNINSIIKTMGGNAEDIFYNFYLVLDKSLHGYNQIIGVKVGPDDDKIIINAKGEKLEKEYLEKFI